MGTNCASPLKNLVGAGTWTSEEKDNHTSQPFAKEGHQTRGELRREPGKRSSGEKEVYKGKRVRSHPDIQISTSKHRTLSFVKIQGSLETSKGWERKDKEGSVLRPRTLQKKTPWEGFKGGSKKYPAKRKFGYRVLICV